jgi:hypothetical protein
MKQEINELEINGTTYVKKGPVVMNQTTSIQSMDDLKGRAWFFRTVTYHIIGFVVNVIGNKAVLTQAAWVADSGRFMNAIFDGTLKEVEPIGDNVIVDINMCSDIIPWMHELPKKQK